MFLLLPMIFRLVLGVGVMALTILFNLAPMIILAFTTNTLFNCDNASEMCRKRFATKTATAAADETEEKKETDAKNKASVVHTVSSAASVRLDENVIAVAFALPGLRSEDLEVKVIDDNVLEVKGATKKGLDTYRVAEQVQLPAVDMETVSATHEDGVLSVKLKRKIRHVTIPVNPVKPAEPAPSTEAQVQEQEALWLAEWDTYLSDLVEMGFDDRASNRAALVKHSGSIKLAVKELRTNRAAA